MLEATGDIRARSGENGQAAWRDLRQGDTLAPAAQVETGRGRAVIGNGEITMTLGADSRLRLPDSDSGFSRVLQKFGAILYKVRFRSPSKFEVETPFLVTTVKGTIFSVTATPEGGSVHVTEGLVEVLPTLGGRSAFVGIGQTATVAAEPGADARVKRPRASLRRGSDGPAKKNGRVTVANDSARPGRNALPAAAFLEQARATGLISRTGDPLSGRNVDRALGASGAKPGGHAKAGVGGSGKTVAIRRAMGLGARGVDVGGVPGRGIGAAAGRSHAGGQPSVTGNAGFGGAPGRSNVGRPGGFPGGGKGIGRKPR